MTTGKHLPNLDKIFRDDEESDFVPSGGSNLAAIFGMQSKGTDVSSSVKEVAQKNVNVVQNASHPVLPHKPDVITAKTVHSFKWDSEQYVSHGQVGMALVGNSFIKKYEIILYINKQVYLSNVTLSQDFSFTVHPNYYASYYDSNNDNWSIIFQTREACIEFVREVGLVRYFLKQGRMDNIMYQDLTVASKEKVAKEGDNVTVKYFIATEIKQPYKLVPSTMQTMTVNISSDDNWERNLLGSNIGLKRILFLPPSKQISLGPGFPKEIDIMLEIEVTDITQPEKIFSSPKQGLSGKASLLSRMARMGQSMLPKIPTSAATDSEDTEVESSEESLQKKSLPQEPADDSPQNTTKVVKPRNEVPLVDGNINRSLLPASSYTSQWPPTQPPSNFVTADGHVHTPQSIQSMMDPSLSMFVSEMRISQAEVRMGMNKISDNVQKVLDKFHAVELQNATTMSSNNRTMDVLKALVDNSTLKSGDNVERVNDLKEKKRSGDFNREVTDKITELTMLVGQTNDMVKSNIAALERKDHNSENKKILSILNTVHQRLMERFVENSYSTMQIKSTIHNVIMDATTLVFEEYKDKEIGKRADPPGTESETLKKVDTPNIAFP